MDKIIVLIAKIVSMIYFDRKKCREVRLKILSHWYGRKVFKNAKSIGKDLCVMGHSTCSKQTQLGDHVCFCGMNIMGGGRVKIGNYFHSGIECLMITRNHNYDTGDAIPYDSTYVYKDIEIGDFVWLGSRVMILPGTKIGEGAIIQGGAVVHGEIPPYAIAGGNPAKVFKYRDIEHFKKLKAEGKFY